MINFLERYHEKFSIEINQPKMKVMDSIIREKEKKRNLANILGFDLNDNIDFKEVKITGDDSVEIRVQPKMFNPYRGAGKIKISFFEGKQVLNTIAQGEIIPYTVGYQIIALIVLVFLFFMTLLTLVTNKNSYELGILGFGWIVLLSSLYLLPFYYRTTLRDYRDSFIAFLKGNKKRKSVH